MIASFQNFAIADQATRQATSKSNRFYKFEPVRGEDWPETAESSEGQDADGGGSIRSPGSSGSMPQIKTLPDGSIDPDSFKDFSSLGGD